MKHLTALLVLLVMAQVGFAQKSPNPKTARMNAYNSLQDYRMSPKTNFANLDEAKTNIEIAVADAEVGIDPKAWLYAGEIYTAIWTDANLKGANPTSIDLAYAAFNKVVALDDKKKFKKDVESGMLGVMAELFNRGSDNFNNKNYEQALEDFVRVIESKNTLDKYFDGKFDEAKIKEMRLDLITTQYYAGVAATLSKKYDQAEALLNPLLDKKVDAEMEVKIFSSLIDMARAKGNASQAKDILARARKSYPGDQSLLITSIQMAQEEGRLVEAEAELLQAVEQDPTNITLKFAVASVYDDLGKKAESEEAKQDYFAKALKYYDLTLQQDPKYFNAMFNKAALFYSQGVELHNKLEAISDMKKYEAERKVVQPKVEKLMNDALPLMLECERMQPSDKSIVGAIRTIYAVLKNDEKMLEYSNKYKSM
jgi:tetratricopeptide (TPR) repeat protein